MVRHSERRYEWTIIRQYHYWTLKIHEDQRYLGRCIVWLRRPGDMQSFTSITSKEQEELFFILRAWEHAVDALWEPDLFNYAWFANYIHEHGGHGHMHCIPRYESIRHFRGRIFTDENYERNYAPYEPMRLRRPDTLAIAAEILKLL